VYYLPQTGEQVGLYQLDALLNNQGGMSRVYRAHHIILGSTHALKILLPHLAMEESFRKRFLEEGRIQARYRHRHIAPVTAVINEGGVCGLVIDWMEGETLEQRLAQGPVAMEEALRWTRQILSALSCVHPRDVIHRDLKPDNLFLTDDGIKILDFGIAKVQGAKLTTVHMLLGTPGYMSPEQYTGDVDVRADLFAVGAILYELLTGTCAFGGTREAIDRSVRAGEYRPAQELNPDLPGELVAIIDRALAPDRERRFESAAAFSDALTAATEAMRSRRRSVLRQRMDEAEALGIQTALWAFPEDPEPEWLGAQSARIDAEIAAHVRLEAERAEALAAREQAHAQALDELRQQQEQALQRAEAARKAASRPHWLVSGGVALLCALLGGGAMLGSMEAPAERLSCWLGDAGDCAALGLVLTGEGAIDPLRVGCDGGVPEACAALAETYQRLGAPELALSALQDGCALQDHAACHRAGLAIASADPAAGAGLLGRACRGDQAEACVALAGLYLDGITPDPEIAVRAWQAACDADDLAYRGAACAALGRAYEQGEGVAADPALASVAYERACQAGEGASCLVMAARLDAGTGVEADRGLAAARYAQACEAGTSEACFRGAWRYDSAVGVTEDDARAAALYDIGCQAGDASSCNNLGVLYSSGSGVEEDDSRAVALYEQACEGGNAYACVNLGWFCERGEAGCTARSRAPVLYEKGCTLGNPRGCTDLGALYEVGREVGVDLAKAHALHKKACDADYALGCARQAELTEAGRGVAVDLSAARGLFEKACTLKSGWGCYRVGYLYEVGLGVGYDHSRAHGYYQKACELDYSSGCTARDRVAPR
jgi:TPR repeat protein